MSDLIDYEVVGWLIERDDESKECVLGTLTDDTYMGEGDEANALVVIRKGSIPTLLDQIKDLQEQLEQKDNQIKAMQETESGEKADLRARNEKLERVVNAALVLRNRIIKRDDRVKRHADYIFFDEALNQLNEVKDGN